jgi:hypothetical protein
MLYRDLLNKDQTKKYELRENTDIGVYVKDLSSFVCKNVKEIEQVMFIGNQNRKIGYVCNECCALCTGCQSDLLLLLWWWWWGWWWWWRQWWQWLVNFGFIYRGSEILRVCHVFSQFTERLLLYTLHHMLSCCQNS